LIVQVKLQISRSFYEPLKSQAFLSQVYRGDSSL
jgi:hypothetical protein